MLGRRGSRLCLYIRWGRVGVGIWSLVESVGLKIVPR